MTVIARRAPSGELNEWPDDLHPVLRQVLSRRNLGAPRELELRLQHIVPVSEFDALTDAVELLLGYRDRNVIVVGDFDADGATSTALMVHSLRALGFSRVTYFIPDRFELGYGLSTGAVRALAGYDDGLIVTVDNGISSVEGVALARQNGFSVLVTDHHLPPEVLPAADVIVNPNVSDSSFPCKNLAGVGVAFYLIAALGRAAGNPGIAAENLDLVAIGTVADLVRLDHVNRILVEQGLRRIRAGQCRPGVLALCRAAGVDSNNIVAATLGYQIGPRLNAAGRLDDMAIGVRCLLTDSRSEADRIASRLDGLNKERREIESRMKQEAIDILDEELIDASAGVPDTICIWNDDWHEGVVGLVASRIKDRYYRPAFAFAPGSGDLYKGSGRSIRGFHLRDALADIDARRPGLIRRFGGHAMAAGLTIARGDLDEFADVLASVSRARLADTDLEQKVLTDGPLAAEHFTLPVATMLRAAAPWGQGFPEPCFDGTFELVESRVLKGVHLRLKIRPDAGQRAVEAIAFNAADTDWRVGDRRRIAFRLDVNDYYSEPRVQVVIEHIEDAGGE